MKPATHMNGEFCKRLLKLIPALALIGTCIPSAQAVEVLDDFENVGNTGSTAIDARTLDGSQNASSLYSDWVLTPNSGPGPSGSIWDTTTAKFGAIAYYHALITDSIINYTNAMTWSADVKLGPADFGS